MSTPSFAKTHQQLGPFALGVPLAARSPASAARTAQVMVAEIGIDMKPLPDRRPSRLMGRPLPPATTNPPANAAPDADARQQAPRDRTRRSRARRHPHQKQLLQAQYQRLQARMATAARSAPSNTRSSSPTGTCSHRRDLPATSAATTTTDATPNARSTAS